MTTQQELNDSFDSMARTALDLKKEHDRLAGCVEEIEALVRKWRNEVRILTHSAQVGRAVALRGCADEVEAVLRVSSPLKVTGDDE